MSWLSGAAKTSGAKKRNKKGKQRTRVAATKRKPGAKSVSRRAAGSSKARVFAPPAWRHYLLLLVFASASVAVAARVVMLGVNEREFLTAQGDARSIRTQAMPAHRGVIYDRHGEPLAVSTPVTSVWADPRLAILSLEQTQALAQILSLDPKKLGDSLLANRTRGFLWLSRRIDPTIASRVEALGLPGVGFEREYKRFYPAGETTSHLLGVTDIDDNGIEGVELAFNEALSGTPGAKKVLRDRRGNNIKDLEFLSPPRLGQDLHLSVDLRLQYFAYRELKAAVAAHKAQSGSLVMLKPDTGEVLAMVNQPAYNPNVRGASFAQMRNRAITDIYEPGSTVKPLTLIAALESGAYNSSSVVDTSPGYLQIGRKLIEDPIDRGALNFERILEKSSQVAIAKLTQNLPDEAIYNTFARAGFGVDTGLGLPGESSGRLSSSRTRDEVSRAILGYGYGFSLTSVQLAQGYMALANAGVAYPLSVLRRTAPPPPQRLFDEQAAAEVRDMLAAVVAPSGTAPQAAVPGFVVGGKTGTARKVGKDGYDDSRHVAWFAGIAPLDDPQIVMVVLINEPSQGLSGGGAVAAPIFSRVAERALRALSVPPTVPLPASSAGSSVGSSAGRAKLALAARL